MKVHRNLGDILIFLLFLIALSGVSYTLVLHAAHAGGGAGRIFSVALMWSPGTAALLTLWVRKLGCGSVGWAWGDNRWNLLAYLLPLGYAVIAYLFVWILGLGAFADAATTASLARSLGWAHSSRPVVLIGYIVSWTILGLVSAIPTALGEEIGWRGFLAPRLVAQTNFTTGALIVGFIMMLWHLPVILFGDYNQGTSNWVAIPCFAIAVMSASVVSTWLRMRSGSVWPCTIFHGVHNLLIQGILTPMTGAKGIKTAYVVGEFGLFVPVLLLVLAIYVWTRRRELAVEPLSRFP